MHINFHAVKVNNVSVRITEAFLQKDKQVGFELEVRKDHVVSTIYCWRPAKNKVQLDGNSQGLSSSDINKLLSRMVH